MTAPRLTLAQQLKQLQGDVQNDIDPETAYTSLDSLTARTNAEEGREHYLDVGPSRMNAPSALPQTLLSDKYGGKASSRMKIFDDDEDEQEGDQDQDGEDDEDEAEGEDDDEEEGDDGEDDEDDEGDEEEEEDDEEDGDDVEEVQQAQPGTRSKLDPIASLRDSRMKDIEKGRAIKRQRTLFENLITLRITYQKSLQLSSKLPPTLPVDAAAEIPDKKAEVLKSLSDLSERLFALREGIRLPGSVELGKRKRSSDGEGEGYWIDSARDSLDIVDESHPHLLPILTKWSTKIQAASLNVSKSAGTSKFLQQTQTSILEAISTSLQTKLPSSSSSEDGPTFPELQESAYRSLLREVIESRSSSGAGGGGGGVDLGVLRKEKKKKREAERGGSKGRKLRYTVHEKAQNFVVPTALEGGWHEEQIDELFASLLGGGGGLDEAGEQGQGAGMGLDDDVGGIAGRGLENLGGLRVF